MTTSENTNTNINTTSTSTLGIVKWFQGGFGFITNFETNEDLFVHHSGVQATVDCWKILYPGEYVHYTLNTMEDGKIQAVNVTGVSGGPLRCETLALLRNEREAHNEANGRTNDNDNDNRGHNNRGHNRGNNRSRPHQRRRNVLPPINTTVTDQ